MSFGQDYDYFTKSLHSRSRPKAFVSIYIYSNHIKSDRELFGHLHWWKRSWSHQWSLGSCIYSQHSWRMCSNKEGNTKHFVHSHHLFHVEQLPDLKSDYLWTWTNAIVVVLMVYISYLRFFHYNKTFHCVSPHICFPFSYDKRFTIDIPFPSYTVPSIYWISKHVIPS